MKKLAWFILFLLFPIVTLEANSTGKAPVRILVITGGHAYEKVPFNEMLESLRPEISFEIAELPGAFDMFLPENRDKYDVLVFYHMWQKISPEQGKIFADCIAGGKPVVALHHSICAFDEWEEYWRIIGGKYFHKPTLLDGVEYAACSYVHDLRFIVRISDTRNPVTKGVSDFEIFDETYKGYWVSPGVKVLLTTNEPTSNSTIGWSHNYGKARVVVLQSGHAAPTFASDNFRKLLKQAVLWADK